MSRMSEIECIDFYEDYTDEELREQKLNNPLRQWREDALLAYKEVESGCDELYYINIVVQNWIDYIHLTKGPQYAEAHRKLADMNILEVYMLATNGFNFTG